MPFRSLARLVNGVDIARVVKRDDGAKSSGSLIMPLIINQQCIYDVYYVALTHGYLEFIDSMHILDIDDVSSILSPRSHELMDRVSPQRRVGTRSMNVYKYARNSRPI